MKLFKVWNGIFLTFSLMVPCGACHGCSSNGSNLYESNDCSLDEVSLGWNSQTNTNFHGAELRITTVAADMADFTETEIRNGVVGLQKQDLLRLFMETGVCLDVLEYLQQIFNFR
jgi:hypothetical protein